MHVDINGEEKEIVGVPDGHKICLIVKVGCKEFLVLHRINDGSLEIKTGDLKQLHNGVFIKRESVLSECIIIMTSVGALYIPLPNNYGDIKLGKTNCPSYDEDFPTLAETTHVEILYYNL
jgi:hypothetical protein